MERYNALLPTPTFGKETMMFLSANCKIPQGRDYDYRKDVKKFKKTKSYVVKKNILKKIERDQVKNIRHFKDHLKGEDLYNEFLEKAEDELNEVMEKHMKEMDAIKLKEENKAKKVLTEKKITVKDKKKLIPKSLKMLVWNKYIGKDKGRSKCLCCDDNDITQMDFHCGHVQAEANGGKTDGDNLKPICGKCNMSMGTHNLEEFQEKYFPRLKKTFLHRNLTAQDLGYP